MCPDLTLTFLLLPRLGIEGIGIAWLTSQVTLAACLTLGTLRPVLFGGKTVRADSLGSAPKAQ